MAHTAETATSVREAAVLSRAVVRAAEALGLNQRSLAATLGVSEATASRMTRGRPIDPTSKQGELAAVVVRLYRSLDALIGGDEAKAGLWMHAHNHHLNGTPAEMIRSVTGLLHVVEYLDAMRGKS
jgi:transcriptional regulator with XRE-family HTH domain